MQTLMICLPLLLLINFGTVAGEEDTFTEGMVQCLKSCPEFRNFCNVTELDVCFKLHMKNKPPNGDRKQLRDCLRLQPNSTSLQIQFQDNTLICKYLRAENVMGSFSRDFTSMTSPKAEFGSNILHYYLMFLYEAKKPKNEKGKLLEIRERGDHENGNTTAKSWKRGSEVNRERGRERGREGNRETDRDRATEKGRWRGEGDRPKEEEEEPISKEKEQIIGDRHIFPDLIILGRSLGLQISDYSLPIRSERLSCDNFHRKYKQLFIMWSQCNRLLALTRDICAPNSKLYICTFSYLYDVGREYARRQDDDAFSERFCEAMKLFIITHDITLKESQDEATIQYGVATNNRIDVLKAAVAKVGDIVRRSGFNSDELKVYDAVMPFQKVWPVHLRSLCSPGDKRIPVKNVDQFPLVPLCKTFRILRGLSDYFTLDSEKRKRIINTDLDFVGYLRHADLKGHINLKFSQLADYFTRMNSFNRKIATHDVNYVNDRLKTFDTSARLAEQTLKSQMNGLLSGVVALATGHLAQKVLQAAIAAAEAFNPLKTLFGGSTLSDIAAATSEMFEASGKVAKASSLFTALDILLDDAKEVTKKLQDSKTSMDRVHRLLLEPSDRNLEEDREAFLAEYGNFSPGVSDDVLASARSKWETVVDEACALIDETGGSIPTLAGQSIMYGKHVCINTKAEISRYMTLMEEINQFQQDMVDNCASFMRAKSGQMIAEVMKGSSAPGTDNNAVTELNELGKLSTEIHMRSLVTQYCDVLEHNDFGRRPAPCEERELDINKIVSYRVRPRRGVLDNFDIPEDGFSAKLTATVNLTALYSGEEVYFQIPNSKWLTDDQLRWITKDEENNPIYIKKIGIYLPNVSPRETVVKTTAEVSGGYKFFEGGPEYVVNPPFQSTYEYREGRQQKTCIRRQRVSNPYTICPTATLPDLCLLSRIDEGECTDLTTPLPSIYSRWKFKVQGYNSVLPPKPATKMTVKAAITLCKLSRRGRGSKRHDARVANKGSIDGSDLRSNTSSHSSHVISGRSDLQIDRKKCCRQGQYWNSDAGSCNTCPKGSHTMLNGYYCGRQG